MIRPQQVWIGASLPEIQPFRDCVGRHTRRSLCIEVPFDFANAVRDLRLGSEVGDGQRDTGQLVLDLELAQVAERIVRGPPAEDRHRLTFALVAARLVVDRPQIAGRGQARIHRGTRRSRTRRPG